jgi:hypothetical protein
MTAEDKAAVEDAVAAERAVRINAIGRAIDQLRITHAPTTVRPLAKTRS